MDNKRTTILAFVAIAMMIAVAFVGFVAIADDGSDATDGETNIVSVTIDGKATTYSDLSKAVEAVNDATTGDVEFKLLNNISIDTAGAATQAAIWFTYTGGTITVDGDKKTITYNATSGSGLNALGFNEGVTAVVKDLTIDGGVTWSDGKATTTNAAHHGLNIYGATVTLNNVISKNNAASGITVNRSAVIMEGACEATGNGWGGVNVDLGKNPEVTTTSSLEVKGTFTGNIWTESLGKSTVTYNGAKITMTMKTQNTNENWKFWYSVGDLNTVVQTAIYNATAKSASDFVITLMDDVSVSETIEITKSMTIDLNGHTITGDKRVFWVKEGALTLTGTGTVQAIDDTPTTSSVIRVGDANDNKNTAGIIVRQNVTISSNFCHVLGAFGKNERIEVEINGTLTSIGDDARAAFINNGSSQWKPTYVTIGSNAKLTSNKGYAIYFPGPGTLDVQGVIEGYGGIEFKSGTGTITVSGFAEIKATADSTEWEINNGGASTSGYAIALVENKDYAGSPTVTISQGADITGTIGILKDYDVSADKQAKLQFEGDVTVDYAIETIDSDRIVIDGTLTMTDSASFSIYTVDGVRIFKTVVIGKLGAVVLDKGATLVFSTNEARGFDATLNGKATIDDEITIGTNDKLTIAKDAELVVDSLETLTINGSMIVTGTVTCDGNLEIATKDSITGAGSLVMGDGSSFTINGTQFVGDESVNITEGTLTISINDAGGFDAVLDGEATIVENFTLGSKDKLTVADDATLSIAKDKFLKLNEGAVISGRVAGQGSNAVVVDGLKAGSNGIKFTSGSLRIDGVIVKDGETAGVTVKIVSGTEVYISGQLKKGATMEVDAGTTVTIENETTFTSNGTITNNGSIVNAGTITNAGTLTNASTAVIVNSGSIENTSSIVNNGTVTNQASSTITNSGSIENKSSIVNAGSIVTSSGTVTNTGTLKMTDSSAVTGSVVNNGIVADERASGSTAVTIDTKSTGAVVTETNADSYGKDVKVIVEDPETTPVSEGTITSTSDSYGFVSAVTTTGKLEIVLSDGYKTYTLTIPKDTVITMGTVVSVEYLDFTSDTTKYEITTPGITEFSVKVPVQTGFKSAKVYCDGSTAGVSNVKYNASSGYVTFDAGHNSTFTIVLSNATPSSGTSDAIDEDTAFVGAIVVLVVAILALAVVIKRK